MRGTIMVGGLIIGLILLINLIILVVCDWIIRQLGMTGITYYCGVILSWLILGGLLGLIAKR